MSLFISSNAVGRMSSAILQRSGERWYPCNWTLGSISTLVTHSGACYCYFLVYLVINFHLSLLLSPIFTMVSFWFSPQRGKALNMPHLPWDGSHTDKALKGSCPNHIKLLKATSCWPIAVLWANVLEHSFLCILIQLNSDSLERIIFQVIDSFLNPWGILSAVLFFSFLPKTN